MIPVKEGMGMNIRPRVALAELQNQILEQESYRDVTISIGRNIGQAPMAHSTWERFQTAVMEIVDTGEAEFHFTGFGRGIYKGQTEESFTITFTTSKEHIEGIRKHLAGIKDTFKQEAIALTVGRTELI